jgi:hypothetical protein
MDHAAAALTPRAVRTFYPYQPSQAAAGVFCALYTVGFFVSLWQTIRHRAWIWLVMVFSIGSMCLPSQSDH